MVCYLIISGHSRPRFEFTSDQFAAFFRAKIGTICAGLDSTSSLTDLGVTVAAPSPIAQLVQFDPVVKEEASRVMASCRATAFS